MYPSGERDQLERPTGNIREESHMSISATTLRLQSELCALIALDADTYFNEPERFISGEHRAPNPLYTQMRARRRRIEQMRAQLQEARFGSVAPPRGAYSIRKVA